MRVLSLFDGMACGLVALKRAGIPVTNYYASEIDKYSIQIAKKNHPETQHRGDVKNINGGDLFPIDLLIGGSPCQGFSIAGKRLNFDDPRSALFFEYVRVLKECGPKYFLLENVNRMDKKVKDIISDMLGVKPILINSALVSAQSRERLYWTNIPGVEQPTNDLGLVMGDIMEKEPYDPLIWQLARGNNPGGIKAKTGKSPSLTASSWQYNNLVFSKSKAGLIRVGTATNIKGHDNLKRIYSAAGKSPTVSTCGGGNREPKIAVDDCYWRKLTPLECERLQTLEDNYSEGVSNTQRYKMIGNGFTVDVIAHILKGITK